LNKADVFETQASHYRHTHDELAYRLYKKDKAGQWRPKKRVEASNELSTLRKKVQDLREEIYTQSHIVYKKAVELDDWNYFESEMEKLSKNYRHLYQNRDLLRIACSTILSTTTPVRAESAHPNISTDDRPAILHT
jgi:coenzyme F420 hydrogenase subunit beta